jgi:hypothetical protein
MPDREPTHNRSTETMVWRLDTKVTRRPCEFSSRSVGGIEGIEYLGNVDNERYRTGVE